MKQRQIPPANQVTGIRHERKVKATLQVRLRTLHRCDLKKQRKPPWTRQELFFLCNQRRSIDGSLRKQGEQAPRRQERNTFLSPTTRFSLAPSSTHSATMADPGLKPVFNYGPSAIVLLLVGRHEEEMLVHADYLTARSELLQSSPLQSLEGKPNARHQTSRRRPSDCRPVPRFLLS